MARLQISAAQAITMAAAGAIFLPALSSCRGRTLDNVEATGETIEVAIDTLSSKQPVVADTLPVPAAELPTDAVEAAAPTAMSVE